jgi:hypothetical protein
MGACHEVFVKEVNSFSKIGLNPMDGPPEPSRILTKKLAELPAYRKAGAFADRNWAT